MTTLQELLDLYRRLDGLPAMEIITVSSESSQIDRKAVAALLPQGRCGWIMYQNRIVRLDQDAPADPKDGLPLAAEWHEGQHSHLLRHVGGEVWSHVSFEEGTGEERLADVVKHETRSGPPLVYRRIWSDGVDGVPAPTAAYLIPGGSDAQNR